MCTVELGARQAVSAHVRGQLGTGQIDHGGRNSVGGDGRADASARGGEKPSIRSGRPDDERDPQSFVVAEAFRPRIDTAVVRGVDDDRRIGESVLVQLGEQITDERVHRVDVVVIAGDIAPDLGGVRKIRGHADELGVDPGRFGPPEHRTLVCAIEIEHRQER